MNHGHESRWQEYRLGPTRKDLTARHKNNVSRNVMARRQRLFCPLGPPNQLLAKLWEGMYSRVNRGRRSPSDVLHTFSTLSGGNGAFFAAFSSYRC